MSKILLRILKKVFRTVFSIFIFSAALSSAVADTINLEAAKKLFENGNYKASLDEVLKGEYQESGEALELLARLYSTDEIGIDPQKVEYFLLAAREKEYVPAIIRLGIFYENGDLLPENLVRANALYLEAHELGDAKAAYFLALNHQFGIGFEANIAKAIEFYEIAIGRGSEDAQMDLGFLYVNEDFGILDYERAYDLFLPLAQKNVVDAQFNLGLLHENLEEFDTALEWYTRAADLGMASAANSAAELHFHGYISTGIDLKAAENFYKLAAQQNHPDATFSLGYFAQHGLLGEADVETAKTLYESAAASNDGYILNQIGLAYSDYETSLFNAETARRYFELAFENGDFSAPINLARTYNYFVNYPDYNKAFQLTLSNLKENLLLARIWYERGIQLGNFDGAYEHAETFANQGDFETAITIILRAIEFAESQEVKDTVLKTHMLSFLASYNQILGFDEEAKKIMEMAIENIETNPSMFPLETKAMTYRDYGSVLNEIGEHDSALEYYELSEGFTRKTNELELLGSTLNGKAIVLQDLGKYHEAINTYKEALDYVVDFEGDVDETVAFIHANLVSSLKEIGEYEQAIFHSKITVSMLSKILAGHPFEIGVVSDLAEISEKSGNTKAALINHQTAAALFSERYFGQTPSSITQNVISEYHKNIHPIGDAANFQLRHSLETKDADLRNEAFVNFQKANLSTAEFDMARLQVRGQVESPGLLKQYQLLVDLTAEVKDEISFELTKDDADLEKIRKLNLKLTSLTEKRTELASLTAAEDPQSDALYTNRFRDVEEVQNNLTSDELLIYPAMTFLDTAVAVFAITDESLTVFFTEITAEQLREMINELRGSLQFDVTQDDIKVNPFDTKLSHEIYKTLFGPIEEQYEKKQKIITVPTWPISNLPLAALISELGNNKGDSYASHTWMGFEKSIIYLTSIADLDQRVGDEQPIELSSFLGIGNPELGDTEKSLRGINFIEINDNGLERTHNVSKLPSLPDTAEELKVIQSYFPSSKSDLFLQQDATEEMLRSIDTNAYRFITFATHGLMADEWENLEEPALILTPNSNHLSDDHDGLLSASEIRELQFSADLIVLSACNTAAGYSHDGEGLSGLASAFIFAGAKAVMASHWSVDSRTTSRLMTHFFESMTKGQNQTKADALRNSMHIIGAKASSSHPIFWAPFVIVGIN